MSGTIVRLAASKDEPNRGKPCYLRPHGQTAEAKIYGGKKNAFLPYGSQ